MTGPCPMPEHMRQVTSQAGLVREMAGIMARSYAELAEAPLPVAGAGDLALHGRAWEAFMVEARELVRLLESRSGNSEEDAS